MATLAELLKASQPEAIDKMNDVASSAWADQAAASPYAMTGEQIDALNESPDLLEKLAKARIKAQASKAAPVEAPVPLITSSGIGPEAPASSFTRSTAADFKNYPPVKGYTPPDITPQYSTPAYDPNTIQMGDASNQLPVPYKKPGLPAIDAKYSKVNPEAVAEALPIEEATIAEKVSPLSKFASKYGNKIGGALSAGQLGLELMDDKSVPQKAKEIVSGVDPIENSSELLADTAAASQLGGMAAKSAMIAKYLPRVASGLGAASPALATVSSVANPLTLGAAAYGAGKALSPAAKDFYDQHPEIPRNDENNPDIGAYNQGVRIDHNMPKELLDIKYPELKGVNASMMPPKEMPSDSVQSIAADAKAAGPVSRPAGIASKQISREPATEENALAKFIKDQEGFSNNTVAKLQEAQDKANEEKRNVNLINAFGRIGSSFVAGANNAAAPDLKQFSENTKLGTEAAEQGVKDFQARAEKEKDDPNSQASVSFRQFLAPTLVKLGMNPNVIAKSSYAQLEKLDPQITKLFTAQEAQKNRLLMASEGAKNRAALMESKKDAKATEQQDKALATTQQLLESARGNPAAAQAEKDLYAAQKADSLFNRYKNPDEMNNAEVQLYATEIAKMASGGVPTIHELQGLDKKTIPKKLADYAETYTNKPTAANAGEFMKRYKAYSDSLANDARRVIEDKYGRVIETKKDLLGPTHYKALQDNYLNRFKKDTEEVKQDKNILKYSKEHGLDYNTAKNLLAGRGYKEQL